MKTKILLVNFTAEEAEKINLPVNVERGYFSDIAELTKESAVYGSYAHQEDESKREVDNIDFYFPHPVYEYNAVFINLNNSQKIKEEFKDKVEKYTNDDKIDFLKYWWQQKKPITLFLGDYNYQDLFNFGISNFVLKKVQKRDSSIKCHQKGDNDFYNFFIGLKSQVKIPTNYYICLGDKNLFCSDKTEFKLKYLYWNNNSDNLGIFIKYHKNYSSLYRPQIIVLPQFENNTLVVNGLIKELAREYPKLFSDIPNLDWIESEEYYPEKVKKYDDKTHALIKQYETAMEKLRKEKESVKEKYEPLRNILINKGEELKENIMVVFKNIFKLNVIDADQENQSSIFKEDIILNLQNRKILAEIKGTKSENPSPLYIGQVWKHILQHEDKEKLEGCLILNYDLEKNPQDRHTAYTGENETGIQDIIFIDTRIIFDLAIAIIDHEMIVEDAVKILFNSGRVEFDLDGYLEEKYKKQEE